MIFFLTTPAGRHVVDEYLCWKGEGDRGFLRSVPYGKVPSSGLLPSGVYIFADIERLGPGAEKAAGNLWERLQADPSRWLTLNRPGRTLRRLELLRCLHREGINRHRAWPVLETPPPDARFPLFLRIEADHAGARSRLLEGPEEYRRALEEWTAGGKNLEGWIACEYAGHRRPDGFFAKYAAFCMAGEVVPRGILFGREWQVKDSTVFNEDLLREERAYVRENPHAPALRRIFDLAGVDYGRVDYGLDAEGRICVWEINTNPQIYSLSLAASPHRARFNDAWAASFSGRMRALSGKAPHSSPKAGGLRRIYWGFLRAGAPRTGSGRLEGFLRRTAFRVLVRFF